MGTLQHTQQSEGLKIQAWTEASSSQAHKTSLISKCSEHTLTIFPGIVYQLIASSKSTVRSHAPRPHVTMLTGDMGIKKRNISRLKNQEKPQTAVCGWHGMKKLFRKLSCAFSV